MLKLILFRRQMFIRKYSSEHSLVICRADAWALLFPKVMGEGGKKRETWQLLPHPHSWSNSESYLCSWLTTDLFFWDTQKSMSVHVSLPSTEISLHPRMCACYTHTHAHTYPEIFSLSYVTNQVTVPCFSQEYTACWPQARLNKKIWKLTCLMSKLSVQTFRKQCPPGDLGNWLWWALCVSLLQDMDQ